MLRARLRLQPCNFNPRSPHGERREQALQGRKPSPFQSTLPARGATTTVDVNGDTTKLFQSTLPARGATVKSVGNPSHTIFQSTLPARGATNALGITPGTLSQFQSTLPARGATPHGKRRSNHPCYFNPRSPHGERRCRGIRKAGNQAFQSTLPARGATNPLQAADDCQRFQSTLPARGATQVEPLPATSRCTFQSTLPARGATPRLLSVCVFAAISIHAPRTGSDHENPADGNTQGISIHAPRTGSDPWYRQLRMQSHHFNPRSPHGERRASCLEQFDFEEFQSTLPARGATSTFPQETGTSQFQSTLPARGATVSPQKSTRTTNFNPRSPHGERQGKGASPQPSPHISIHAPRTGSDAHARCPCSRQRAFQSTLPARGATTLTERIGALAQLFQSTLPARGATGLRKSQRRDIIISIHAPRTGSDEHLSGVRAGRRDFNPRSPHGERPYGDLEKYSDNPFQSTLPARGATSFSSKSNCSRQISIHAPRTGSDTCGLSDSPHR